MAVTKKPREWRKGASKGVEAPLTKWREREEEERGRRRGDA